jgi:hypothetical protein
MSAANTVVRSTPILYVSCAMVLFGTAAALDLLPLGDPASARLVFTLTFTLALVTSTLARPAWVLAALAWSVLLLLRVEALPAAAVMVAALALLWDRAGAHAPARVVGVTALVGLVTVQLDRTLGPGFVSGVLLAPIDRVLAPFGSPVVHAEAFGIALLPAAVCGVVASGAPWYLRTLLVALVVVAAAVAKVEESAWPLVLAWLVPLAGAGAASPSAVPADRRVGVGAIALWATLLVVSLLSGTVASSSLAPREEARTVAFLGARHGSFERPALPLVAAPDPMAPPRFGEFRRRVELAGLPTIDALHPRDVAGIGVGAFVAINFHGEEAEEWIEPLRAAVKAGADLLVLADHTDLFGQMAPTNRLLEGTGIALEFDSAVPWKCIASWMGGVAAGRDALFGPHRDGVGMSWGVGCSLSARWPARTLLAGTRGFLDKGVREKAGGLDNLARDDDERLGGFTLAASARLGAGRVLVLGDTSALQDTALIDGAAFVSRVTDWLAGGGSPAAPPYARPWVPAWIALLAWIAFLVPPRRVPSIAVVLAVVALAEASFERRTHSATIRLPPPARRIDLPDSLAHGPLAGTARLDPLIDQVTALGWSLVPTTSRNEAGAATVLVDPRTPLTRTETRRLLDHVARGGRLLMFVGERGGTTMEPLLAELGVAIGPPVGRGVDAAWAGPLSGHDFAPLFSSGFAIQGAGLASAEVLATVFGAPTAVRGRIGAGTWLLVADGGLCLDVHADPRRGGTRAGAITLELLLTSLLGETS